VILPNNANVKLAAGQAAEMADRPVRVVPTRNAAEGLAALLALDPPLGASGNAEPMLEASRAVETILVTEAVRDATVGGRPVKRGQCMASTRTTASWPSATTVRRQCSRRSGPSAAAWTS